MNTKQKMKQKQFEYMIKDGAGMSKADLEVLAKTLGCNISQGHEHGGHYHYFFTKGYLNRQDIIKLHKLGLDNVVMAREAYDHIQKNTKISSHMPWLKHPQSKKTPQKG